MSEDRLVMCHKGEAKHCHKAVVMLTILTESESQAAVC